MWQCILTNNYIYVFKFFHFFSSTFKKNTSIYFKEICVKNYWVPYPQLIFSCSHAHAWCLLWNYWINLPIYLTKNYYILKLFYLFWQNLKQVSSQNWTTRILFAEGSWWGLLSLYSVVRKDIPLLCLGRA